MRKKWRQITGIVTTCAMLTAPLPALAAETEAAADTGLVWQLSLEDLDTLNDGAEKVFMHDDKVTLVDGTCSDDLVTGVDDAAAVVDSMITLIGGDSDTEFIPWREVIDPLGNMYYIFQQMYHDTTVLGGAVKVITDADCNMIGLTSSLESEMPDVSTEEGITAEEAEQIVADKEIEATGLIPEVLGIYTSKVILPSVLEFDIENEDESSRFAWVVYTNNPSGNVRSGSDLPYLAHYVSMSGDYLYNLAAIAPDDEAGRAGYDSSYIFEFMEPAEYTGYVDMSDGTEKEITVTVMRDKRTGMYYLGNIERRILVAQCYPFLYEDGQVVLESSPDNLEWDQVGLLSLYNYCRVWDYYKDIGWTGGDGEGTPIIILNNYCDDHKNEVDNACYAGKIYGMQTFLASKINDYSQCLDVIAHEFTHCVTGTLMTHNSYMNDYGAINEGMSDIQGKNCQMMLEDTEADDWIIGSHSVKPGRSMSDPHLFGQPEYTWDEYYIANAKEPGNSNDHGGVHFNSSLLNQISYLLMTEGGMSYDEARTFWFMVDAAMVPGTDYPQLAEILPWVLKNAGMEQYAETLDKAISQTRLGDKAMPETLDEDHAMVTLTLPDTEAFDNGNWMLTMTTIKVKDLAERGSDLLEQLMNQDYSFLPEPVQELIEEGQEKEYESEARDMDLLGSLTDAISSLTGHAKEEEAPKSEDTASEDEADMIKTVLSKWLFGEIGAFVFSSYGFAGQDGSTMNMVVRPGRCIPMIQHTVFSEGSQEPDQLALAICVNGKWYDIGLAEIMEDYEQLQSGESEVSIPSRTLPIVTDVLSENIDNLDIMSIVQNPESLLDLFTIEIKGGEITELPTKGLDAIVVPEPTPPAEKKFGHIEPGKKSRPKLDAETETEAEAETETETEAEVETESEVDKAA